MSKIKDSKHTPGPWTYSETTTLSGNHAWYTIMASKVGKQIVGTKLASVDSEENARLIAAAPELLLALKTAMYQLELHAKKSGGDYILKQAKVAISKAEGGK